MNENKSWLNGENIRSQVERWVTSIRSVHWSVFISITVGLLLLLMLSGYGRVKRKLRETNSTVSAMELLARVAIESLKAIISPRSFFLNNSDPAVARIDFYDRFENLMNKHQFERARSQTQREFGHEIIDSLSKQIPEPSMPNIENAINFIIDSFYNVRFNNATIDPNLINDINSRTLELELLLQQVER